MPSTTTSTLAAIALVGALAGVGTLTSPAVAPETRPAAVEMRAVRDAAPAGPAAAEQVETVPIECGGYGEDGSVVNEGATRIDRVPVDDAGIPLIPAVCGGYTADGTFIGDD